MLPVCALWIDRRGDGHSPFLKICCAALQKKLVDTLDAYGGPRGYDPMSYEKTLSGAIISTVFRLAFVALLCFNLFQLLSFIEVTTTAEVRVCFGCAFRAQ